MVLEILYSVKRHREVTVTNNVVKLKFSTLKNIVKGHVTSDIRLWIVRIVWKMVEQQMGSNPPHLLLIGIGKFKEEASLPFKRTRQV
jgi:hypothetical protein